MDDEEGNGGGNDFDVRSRDGRSNPFEAVGQSGSSSSSSSSSAPGRLNVAMASRQRQRSSPSRAGEDVEATSARRGTKKSRTERTAAGGAGSAKGSAARNSRGEGEDNAVEGGDNDGDDDDEDGEAFEMDAFLPGSAGDAYTAADQVKELKGVEADDPDDPLTLVKRAVPETDDPTLPALTLRVVVIGSMFAVLGAGVAQLFFYKSNSPGFSSYFVILVSLPMGRWLARNMPYRTVRVPLIGPVELNPGDFSIK